MLKTIRRLIALSFLLGAVVIPSPSVTGQSPLVKSTVAYRQIDGHQVLADVYRPAGKEARPVIVWIHGGALIMGHREAVPRQIRQVAQDNQVALVSLDYRLAPETKLPDLIGDIEAAFRWLADEASKKFALDAQRIVVCGGSAGGYLTLVTGYRCAPRPVALVSFYGYGSLTSDWYTQPSQHPRHNPRKITRQEAEQQTDGSVISDARQRKGNGALIYLYYRQNGIWPRHISGFDPASIAEQIAPFEPVRHVDADYPPTMLIHGTADTDVPYSESVMMAEQLKKHGVPFQLVTIKDAEHGLAGGDPDEVQQAYVAMREFMIKHLERP